MSKLQLRKMNWIGIATGVVPPLLEAIGAVWGKRQRKKNHQGRQHLVHELEAKHRCLSEKDTEIVDLKNQLAASEQKLAQAQHTIELLQQELAAEKKKPWWEKAISWLRDRMGFQAH